MKVIDLLNKIANEELRYDVKINTRYEYSTINEYLKKYGINEDTLNVEVIGFDDIIEESKGIPEKMLMCTSGIMSYEAVEHITTELKDKINEIIDFLESKGE